jgi:hypothetical protein
MLSEARSGTIDCRSRANGKLDEAATVSGPRRTSILAKSLRAKVFDEARRDATAFVREFARAIGANEIELEWIERAWADLRDDFRLEAEESDRLWPAYWNAFQAESVKLAAELGRGA